jgi:hypothetical protein
MASSPYRVTPDGAEPEDGRPMLSLVLDLLTREASTTAAGPVPYTEAMAAEDDGLLADFTVDSMEWPVRPTKSHAWQVSL